MVSYVMSRVDMSADKLNFTVIYNDTKLSYSPNDTVTWLVDVSPLLTTGSANVASAFTVSILT